MEVINGINVAKKTLKSYVGHYTFSEFTIDVTLKDNRLSFLVLAEEQKPFIIYAKLYAHIFAKVIDLQVSFKHNNYAATSLIIH